MKPQILKLYISLELLTVVSDHQEPDTLMSLIEKNVLEYIKEKGVNSEYKSDEVVIEKQIIQFKGEIRPFSVRLDTFDNKDKNIHLSIKFTDEDRLITEFAEFEITPNVTTLH